MSADAMTQQFARSVAAAMLWLRVLPLLMFWEKFLMSDILATNLMLTGRCFFRHFLPFAMKRN